jgi:hypothetical protein
MSRLIRRIVPILAIAAAALAVAPTAPAQAGFFNQLVAAYNSDGREEWFWGNGNDGGYVYHKWASVRGAVPSSGEYRLVGSANQAFLPSSGLGATNNNDGRLEVFARGYDEKLWHAYQLTPGGSWSNWQPLSGRIKPWTSLEAWLDASTRTIHVQVQGVDGYTHVLRQLGHDCCWNTVWE